MGEKQEGKVGVSWHTPLLKVVIMLLGDTTCRGGEIHHARDGPKGSNGTLSHKKKKFKTYTGSGQDFQKGDTPKKKNRLEGGTLGES